MNKNTLKMTKAYYYIAKSDEFRRIWSYKSVIERHDKPNYESIVD